MGKRFLPTAEKFLSSYQALIVILSLTLLIRLPSLFEPLWVDDEAIYLTAGQKILRGGLMYVDIFDHKTLGIYYLAVATIKFFGASIWSWRFLLMIWVLASLVAFYFLAKRLFNRRIAIWAVIFLALLTSTPLIEGNVGNSEILMILPTILGISVGLNKKFVLSGIFFSLAFLFKAPAILDFTAFFIFVALTSGEVESIFKNLSRLAAGFFLPVLLTVGYFFAKGALGTYLYSTFWFNIGYVHYNNRFLIQNGLLIIKALPLLFITAYLIAKAYRPLKSRRREAITPFEFLILWLFFAFFGAVFAGRPYEHYLIQATPPFALIAALVLFQKKFVRLGVSLLLAAVFLTFALGFRPAIRLSYYPNFFRYVAGRITFDAYADSFKAGTSRNYALASFLKGCKKFNTHNVCEEFRTNPGDKLYVFSDAPAIYFLSGLDPATRYINFYHVVEDEAVKKAAAKEIVEAGPKYILVEANQQGQFPALENILSSRYNLFAFYEDMAIYQIIPTAAQ